MKLAIEPTDEFFEIDGALSRRWIGRTESGGTCHVYVIAIAIADDQATADYYRQLIEIVGPVDPLAALGPGATIDRTPVKR